MTPSMRWTGALALAAAPLFFSGCAAMPTIGRAAATPLTLARDTVDAPLVTITNVFGFFADRTRPARAPNVGVGWSPWGGFGVGIGYDVTHYFCRGVSWVVGGADYVAGRSLWPGWPRGLSPFKPEDEPWGTLYFPSTRALWRDPGGG